MKQLFPNQNPPPAMLEAVLLSMACADAPKPGVEDWALFMDIDGTLSDIAQKPEAAFIPADMLEGLAGLESGAIALITGRSIASADAMTQPYRFNVAGQHGLEMRGPGGKIMIAPGIDYVCLSDIMQKVGAMAEPHEGLVVERKSASIAVHYRLVPHKGPMVMDFLRELAASYSEGFSLQPGKMVGEIRPRGADKGTAIALFMQAAPFTGKIPVFAGDDVTDEAGFRAVNALGGISIKIGQGQTHATHRIADPPHLRYWLSTILPLLNEKQERMKL